MEAVEGLPVVVRERLVKATIDSVLNDEHSEMRSLSAALGVYSGKKSLYFIGHSLVTKGTHPFFPPKSPRLSQKNTFFPPKIS